MTRTLTSVQLGHRLGAATAGLQQMQASLAGGELKMDDEAGSKLSAAPETARNQTATLLYQVAAIGSPAQLGANHVWSPMTGEIVGRATGDGTALEPTSKQYQGVLARAKSSVDAAVAMFEATDGAISSGLAGI